jgi:hypothetical protein
MAIIPDSLAAVSPANASGPHYGTGLAPSKTPQPGKNDSDGAQGTPAVTAPPSDRILINELEGANEEIREVARQIREVDHTMDVIAQNLEKMTTSLETIVKQYPPYLLNDKERVTALRQFLGLRQMIDKLTVPAPDDTPAKILGDKKIYPQAGDWEFPSGKGHAQVTLRHQPVHSGADGLDLPDLSIESSDASVQKAFGQMTRSHEVLRKRRDAFAGDANRVMASFF